MPRKNKMDQGGDALNALIKSLSKHELAKVQPGLDKIDREERTNYKKKKVK